MFLPSTTFLLATLAFTFQVNAQGATPPASFPPVPSSTSNASSASASGSGVSMSTVTVTPSPLPGTTITRSVSISGSGSMSGNATQTTTAQFPSLSGFSSCVSNCLATSISTVGCGSIVDVNCFCPIDRFPLTYMNCLLGSCPSDLSSAETLANQFCQLSNGTSTSISFPPVPTPSSSGSSSSNVVIVTAAPSSSGTGTSGARGLGIGLGWEGNGFGAIVVMLSVVLGAIVV